MTTEGGGGGGGGGGEGELKEKRKSLDMQRQMRTANIQESTRVAMHYSAERRKTSRPDTLPRDSRSTSLSRSITSASSENDLLATTSSNATTTSSSYFSSGAGNRQIRGSSSPPTSVATSTVNSSPAKSSSCQKQSSSTSPSSPSSSSSPPAAAAAATTAASVASVAGGVAAASSLPQHEPSSSTVSDASSSTTALNLRHLSIDQTKEASLTQMDEIWRQVEAISSKPYLPGGSEGLGSLAADFPPAASPTPPPPPLLPPSLDEQMFLGLSAESRDEVVQTEANGSVVSMSPLGGEGGVVMAKRRSEVLKESDIVISVLEPVDQSTPLRPPPLPLPLLEGSGASMGEESGLLRVGKGQASSKLKNRPPSFSNQDIDSLLDTLKSLSSNEDDEELKMLEEMLKSNTFKKAKQVHDDMRMLLAGKPSPAMHRIVPSTQLMRQHLHHHTEQSREVEELRDLLRSPHVQAILFCHDKVSSHDLYVPDAHFHQTAHDPVDIILSGSVDHFQVAEQATQHHVVSSRDVPFNRKEGATVVFLERTNRPLGCTIYKQEDSVFVGKLLKGCDAEASDMLREGDELLEVNGVSVMGLRTDEIIRLMSGDVQPGTSLAFTIIPVHDESYDIDYEPKYMRAHFNYNNSQDSELPCQALGLSFQKGDIVEIINEDDPEWWQACKVFEENAASLPGLIPSMHLQQQREALIHSYSYNSPPTQPKKGLRGIFSRKKKKKIYYQNTTPGSILGVGDEIPTYEQVIRLEPDPSLCRPIVLIGAPGVGRRMLIKKLMNSDPSLYRPVVQHTTRLIRPGEVNGHDYHFVTREEFERDIEQDRFLEHEELRGHYLGTAYSSVKTIMESGRVPVLDLHPQALKKIRHSGVRPYVVFVGSPRLERLQLTRKVGTEKLKRRLVSSPHHSSDLDSAQIYTESDLQHLVKESYLIENQYGHYFDWIIVNDDFQVAADMLKEVARRLETEPQWVPHAWKNY